MKHKGLGIIALMILLVSLNAQGSKSEANDTIRISVKGAASYSIQLDARTGEETLSFSYSLQVENGGSTSTSFAVRTIFHDIEPDSLQTLSPAIRLVRSIDLGRFVESVFNVTAPPGASTFEIFAKPRAVPFSVSQDLVINEKPANVTAMGPYRYASIKVGDLLVWKVKVANQYWSMGGSSERPRIPLLMTLSLDPEYFDVISMSPTANSTKEGKETHWNLILQDSAEIELKIKVTKLSEWGIAQLSPFIISYSSDMMVSFLEMMKGRAASLRASAGLLESLLRTANSSVSLVGDIAKQLEIAGNAMIASGTGTAEAGDALLMIAGEANSTARALGALSPQLQLLLEFTSPENMSRIVEQVKSTIDSTTASLQNVQNTLSTQAGVLLQLNATLTTLLNQISNPQQRDLVLSSIAMTDSVYSGISGTIPTIQDVITSLNQMKTFLDQVNLSQLHAALVNFSISINQLQIGMTGMSNGLSEVGRQLKTIGRTGFDQFRYLSNLSSLLRQSANATTNSITQMRNNASEARAMAERVDSEIRNTDVERERLSYLSPEIVTDKDEPLAIRVTEDGALNRFLEPVSNEASFVKYLAFNSTSALEIWNLTEGNWVKVENVSSLGVWRKNDTLYLPVFSCLKVNETEFDWLGKFPMRLTLVRGYHVTVYCRTVLGNETELVVATLLQPDLATEINPAPIIPGEPGTPQTGELSILSPQVLAVASFGILGAALVFIYFWNTNNTRTIARTQERLKKIEERRKLRAESDTS